LVNSKLSSRFKNGAFGEIRLLLMHVRFQVCVTLPDFIFSLACAKGVILVVFSSLLLCAVRTPFAELPFTAKNWLGSARELGVLQRYSSHRQKGLFRDI
jgi:hypothetical protein